LAAYAVLADAARITWTTNRRSIGAGCRRSAVLPECHIFGIRASARTDGPGE